MPSDRRKGKAAEYEVGYGKPPEANRFKPGTSGNPKGRKKGAKTLLGHLADALDEKITIREGDRVRITTKREAGMQMLVARFLKGDPKAAMMVASLLKNTPELQPPAKDTHPVDDNLSADDQALMDRFLKSEGGNKN